MSSQVLAQWKNANPGHGGQLQHVVCDPNVDGRMYLCSDMEGYYYSDDYGQKWHYVHSSPFNNVFNIAVAPSNSNTMLLGATNGLAVSKDQGDTWTIQEGFKNIPISAMAIDPSDENNMYVAPSWLEDVVGHFSQNGEKAVYSSNDGGATWNKKVFSGVSGERNVNTITVHPTNGEVLLAATEGLFLSSDNGANWNKLESPSNTSLCRGADITPDGEWVYALYVRNDNNSGLYVRKYNETTWTELDANGLLQTKNQTHWRPLISKTSTETEHFMLMGTFKRGGNGTENALLEGRFTVAGDVVSGAVVEVFKNPGMEIQEIGWNDYQGVSRTYDYYPASWTNHSFTRGAFIMSQQSAYVGDVTETTTWNCVTSTYVKTLNGRRFYKTNGTASTYNWDMVGYKNYIAQLMGDNGIVESYDGGDTWNQPTIVFQGNWNADAGEVVLKEGHDPLLLVGTANGFGGAQSEWSGKFLMKTLTNLSGPSDQYKVLIDGKSQDLKGLGDQNRISSIHSDPLKPERVYISTIGGAYVTDDIFELIDDNSDYYFRKISNGEANSQGRKIFSDPNDSNIVYLRCGNGTFRGERQSNGEYTWTKLLINGSSNGLEGQWGSNGDMAIWAQGNKSYLLVTKGNSSNVDYELHLSDDKGENFTKVVDRAMAEPFGMPEWVSIYNNKTGFGGLAGKENEFYFTFHVRENGEKMSNGISFFKATIGTDLSDITLEDLTGTKGQNDLEYPLARRGKIWKDENNKEHLYIATMGTGLWMLPLQSETQPIGVIEVDQNYLQVPAEVTFDGSNSYASSGRTITAYEWTYQDEVVSTTSEATLSFDEAGAYSIYLKVTDDQGEENTVSFRFVGVNDNVNTVITASETMGYAPFYVKLDGESSSSDQGEIVGYTWYHDSETVGTSSSLNVDFQTAGKYLYVLEAEDVNGRKALDSLVIQVYDYDEGKIYQTMFTEDLEGYVYTGVFDWEVWVGAPKYGTLADDNVTKIHYGPQWGIHGSSGYPNASGNYSAFIQANGVFSLENLDVSGVDKVKLSFGMMKCSVVDGEALQNEDDGESLRFEYSTDGVSWTEVSLSGHFDYVNEQNSVWYWVELDEEIPSVDNLRLRWTKLDDSDPYNTLWRVDDITFKSESSLELKAPTVSISASSLEIDRNESTTFQAEILGTASSIEWDFKNEEVASDVGPHEVMYKDAGDYDVTVTVKNSGFEKSASSTLTVNNSYGAIDADISINKSEAYNLEDVTYSITHNADGNLQYKWTFGEGVKYADESEEVTEVTTTTPSVTIQYVEGGTKSIAVTIITNDNKQFDFSGEDMIEIEEREITSIDDLHKYGVKVYPNPMENDFRIKGISSGSYQVINQIGQVVWEGQFQELETISLEIPKGIYFMKISDGEKVMTHKFIRK
ncbi:T9SS type A sorting domain-containing protein [Flammeovirga sp. MY04]|uniref:PKD domain-containing protein n=1 Tax=Flammeovirga sp. MY04 TaxID=1191459 RepID=UPI0008063DFA|nr:PKD domain-containing protein [Flammeovirga sp. MY04]ANQ52550.1 T9SS type A sorting domain-containing protein [Flammeovirga sp. MY04]